MVGPLELPLGAKGSLPYPSSSVGSLSRRGLPKKICRSEGIAEGSMGESNGKAMAESNMVWMGKITFCKKKAGTVADH